MINVENLRKTFGSTIAVDGISFEVKKGEVVGFLGPNGAGKSTTMRILTCYLLADSGKATIAGFDVNTQSVEVRKHIGYLPENNPLYTDIGVIEFLQFVASIRHIPKGQIKKRLSEIIEICGLESVAYKDIGELSKGYRQRVGLAQALIHDPEILVLDEPTIGLDPHQIIEIRNLIKEIGKQKTIILSSHILPEVSATCSRLLIINKGRLVGSGTPEEVSGLIKGEETIFITIKGPLESIREKLDTLKGVKEYKVLDKKDGFNQFEIKTEKGIDLREELFHMVSNNGWSLNELYKKTLNLEEVFLELTTEE